MDSLVVLCIFMVPVVIASYDVADLCPGTVPLQRVAPSGVGCWWTVMATSANSGSCGLNNNEPPCKCTGFIFTSNMEAPYIPDYNCTLFGYDTTSQCYNNQTAKLSLVDKSQPWAIFNFTDESASEDMVVSALDTDDHNTFIIFWVCGQKSQTVFVVSKYKTGLCKESQDRVDKILKKNNICKESLQSFDTSDCLEVQ